MAGAIRVLFGTETGNAEECANKLLKTIQGLSLQGEVLDMEDYDYGELDSEDLVFVVTSTFGSGEPPYNAREFMDFVKELEPGSLDGVRFAVCGLGDSSYPNFAKCGKDFDRRFEAAGAERVVDRKDCDVAFDGPFAKWQAEVERWLLENIEGAVKAEPAPASANKGGLFGSIKKWFGK